MRVYGSQIRAEPGLIECLSNPYPITFASPADVHTRVRRNLIKQEAQNGSESIGSEPFTTHNGTRRRADYRPVHVTGYLRNCKRFSGNRSRTHSQNQAACAGSHWN